MLPRSAAALKRAFRDQARRWHPDLNGSDPVAEERFKQVNEAYAVLSDPRRRRAWESGEAEDGTAAADPDPFATGFPGFEAYLDRLFGRDPGGRDPGDVESAQEAPQEAAGHGGWGRSDDDQRSSWGVTTTPPPPPPPVRASSDHESLLVLSPEQEIGRAHV